MKKETFEKMQNKRGVVFKAKVKKTATSPDYTGTLKLEDQLYYVSGWVNKSKAGLTYLSISVEKNNKPLEDLNTESHQQSIVVGNGSTEDTIDDLPF